MVGPLMLLKILHCKQMCKKSPKREYQNQHSYDYTSAEDCKDIKSELPEKQRICRICLKEGDIPIYDTSEDISEAIITFGGINLLTEDQYPKYMCYSCNSLLQGAILFRKTAQQSDQLLRQPIQEPHHSENDDESNNLDEENTFEYEEVKVKEPKRYHCKRCNLDFPSFIEYSDHRLSDEHENKRHTCPICNNTYTTLYFKKHLALHKLETPFMCDICGKKFVVQGHFTRHRVTHFYNLPFKCTICPYRGRFSESLKMHMRSHTGEKPYQCTQCASRFVNKSNLNKHMLTHRGAHDFKCDSCGRGFYTRRDLDLHFKVDHTGIKDHRCDICGKAFGYRKQMMKHQLKVHKREKLRSGRMPLYLQVETKKQLGEDVITES